MKNMETKSNNLLVPLSHIDKITTEQVDNATRGIFSALFDSVVPSKEIEHGIIIGLLVKAKKLYKFSYAAADRNEMLTFNILLRSFYETSITLRYILAYLSDDDTIKKFIIGSVMSDLHSLKGDLKNEKINTDQYKQSVAILEASLSEHQVSLSDIPKGFPKSWHPTKTYREIAKSLDSSGEALGIYDSLYSATSLLAHPSMMDIMKWHVTKFDNDSPYIPNENNMYLEAEGKVVLQCACLAMLEAVARSSDECTDLIQPTANLHRNLHLTFNDKRGNQVVNYVESVQRYAEFWHKNYPENNDLAKHADQA